MKLSQDSEVTRMAAVGDVYINRSDPREAFENVKPFFDEFDIVFANLEAPMSTRGLAVHKDFVPYRYPKCALRSPPETVLGLIYGGIDIVSFANNHSLDFGPDALVDTMDILEKNGIQWVGAGKNIRRALKPIVVEKKNAKIAFVAFDATPYKGLGRAREDRPGIARIKVCPLYPFPFISPLDLNEMADVIRRAKSLAPFVAVSFHWGESEDGETLTVYQKELGHRAIDAGADLILGHHPHSIQGFEIYKGRIICHSLSNFIFEYDRSEWKNETVIFGCSIAGSRIEEAFIIPAEYINPKRQPTILSLKSTKGKYIFNKLKILSAGLGATMSVDSNKDRIKIDFE